MKLFVTAPLITLAARLVLVAAPAAAAPPPVEPAPAVTEGPAIDESALADVVELNKKALASLNVGQPDAAMTHLLAAARIAETKGLGNHDIMARTQIHLGICAIQGLGDRQRGLEHFARALAIRPQIKLTPQLSTPALNRDLRLARRVKPGPATAPTATAAKEEAKLAAKEASQGPAKDQGKDKEGTTTVASAPATDKAGVDLPPLPAQIPQPLYCPTPDQGPPGQEVPLFCVTQPELTPQKVVAYFRPGGGEAYTAVPMDKSPTGWLSAIVPAKQVKGRSLQVYFEAHDDTGNVAANNGKDELPNVIALKPGAPQITPKSLAMIDVGAPPPSTTSGDEETPLELRERELEKAAAEAEVPRKYPRRSPGRLWVGLGFGSGYGWHRELKLENHYNRYVQTGFSSAGLGHLAPEIGYQLTPRLSFSLQTRHQYLPTSGSGDAEVTRSPPQMAHALLARVHFALLDLGNFQFVGSLAGGGGDALRMQVAPNRRVGIASSDTMVAGRGVAGPGLALAYNFSQRFVGLVEGRALAAFPVFAVLMEGTASVQYTF
ncbi:MAG TPA: tetratricopeptide repeat protein [Polyangia bacterium]